MTDAADTYRLYGDLAAWWHLISPAEEYVEEAAFAAGVLASGQRPTRTVLELGSGGGSNACHLKSRFDMTLVDLSAAMLDASRAVNPECEHLLGDMRTIRLGREFDAVFVHDAIDYMTTEDDLAGAIATAGAHCRPGGVAVFMPDVTVEQFRLDADDSEHGGHDGPDSSGARYFAWSWDPDPDDSWIRTDYVFVLRDATGSVEVVHEAHRIGMFSRELWLGLLADHGLEPVLLTEQTSDDRVPRDVFVGHRSQR